LTIIKGHHDREVIYRLQFSECHHPGDHKAWKNDHIPGNVDAQVREGHIHNSSSGPSEANSGGAVL